MTRDWYCTKCFTSHWDACWRDRGDLIERRDKILGQAWAANNSNPRSYPKPFTVVPRHEPTIVWNFGNKVPLNRKFEPIEDEV